MPLRAPSDAVSITTSAATASSSTSTRNLKSATSSVASTSSDITKDDLSPGACRIYNYLIGASTNLDPIHDAVDIGAVDLVVSAPTTCSSESTSHDASVSVVALISSATPNSSTTTHGVIPELCYSDLEPATDASVHVVTSNSAPTVAQVDSTPATIPALAATYESMDLCPVTPSTSSTLGLDDCTGNEDSVDMSLTPGISTVASEACSVNPVLAPGASAFSLMPAAYLVDDVDVTKLNEIRLPPWHPPWQGIRCKEMIQVLLMHDFILESTQLMLWAARNPWPPPFPNMSAVERARNKIGRELCCFSSLSAELLVLCFASCRIPYLHGTLDNMQLSGDWQVQETVGLKWSATLIVIIFALGVQCAQLKPTVFKWFRFCYDTDLLIASTDLDMKLDLLLARQATYTVWNWCCFDNLYGFPRSTDLATQHWGMLISSPETWVVLNCHSARVTIQWTIAVQRVPTDVVRKGWISHHILRGTTNYSELMQWLFNHSVFLSEFRFCIPGHILFFCCDLVQMEIAQTISLMSLNYWFQCFHADRESLYGCENFQWTIAWSLSYPFSLSRLQNQTNCVISLVQPNCPAIYQQICFRFMMGKLTSAAVLLIIFLGIRCAADVEPFLLNCALPYGFDCFQCEIARLLEGSSGVGSDFVDSGIVTITFWPHSKLGLLHLLHCRDLSFSRYPSVDQIVLKSGHLIQSRLELAQWKIAWSLHLDYFDVGNQSRQLIPTATLTYLTLHGAMGSWPLGTLCFYKLFAQAAAQGGITVEALASCYGHYIAASLDQALFSHDHYINLVQVHLDHIYDISQRYHHDPSKIEESHVPWDPGGFDLALAWGQAEFYGGGIVSDPFHGLGGGCHPLGLGPLRGKRRPLQIEGTSTEDGAWNGRTERRLRPRPGLACVCCVC